MKTICAFALTLLVLFAGCLPSYCRASTESRLAMAVRHRNLSLVSNLLADGADVNERDEGMEQTPLMRAALTGDPQIVQMLLANGAEVNAQDDEGNTALILAVKQGSTRVVQLLLAHGAIPQSRDSYGANALTIAHRKGRVSMARLLENAVRQNRRRLTYAGIMSPVGREPAPLPVR